MRRLIAVAVALLCATHVAMTAIYLAPANLLKLHTQQLVARYMTTLFQQDWNLFSPDPGITIDDLWLRCQSADGSWREWIDPFDDIRQEHNNNRVSGRGKLLYVYNHLGKGLKEVYGELRTACQSKDPQRSGPEPEDRCLPDEIAAKAAATPSFKVVQRFASDFCAAHLPQGQSVANVQFKVMTFFPKKFSERGSVDKRWSGVNEMLFPAVAPSPTSQQRTELAL